MKQHTSQFKEQIKNLGRQFDSVITYANTQLKEEIFSASPSYEGTILKSVMKQLVIETSVEIPLNTVINYQIGLLVNGAYEYLDYGNYVVMTSEKEEDKNLYRLTCYDKMLRSMIPYEGIDVAFPMTVREYLTNLCVKIGLVFENQNSSFANYNRMILSDPYVGLEYTYRDVFDELAQVTASTICINDNDRLEVRYITDTNDVIDEEYLKDVNVNFAEKYGKINSIVLSRASESDNVYLRDEQSVIDNGLCELKIIDNQIMNNNDRSDYLPDILARLNGLEYYINDFSSTGILYYDLCDRYSVQVAEQVYSCIMFNNEVNVTTGVEEFIYTNMPEQSETDYTKADKTDRRINQTYLIVDKQNQKIEEVITNVTEQNSKISQITQTVDELNTKIQDIADITVAGESSYGVVDLNNINESEPILIKIRPITQNISYLYPNTNLFPSTELFMTTRTVRFTRSYRENGENKTQIIDYELPDDLLFYDNNTYDEFYLDYDSKTCQVTKRCAYNADGTVRELANEVITNYTYPEILLSDGNYRIELLNYSTGYLFVRLMTQNAYTNQFATKVEMTTEIKQTANEINIEVDEKLNSYPTKTEMNSAISLSANEINLQVSKKVGNDEIISKINQSAEQIQIDANKISLAGKAINLSSENITINSDNFAVDKYGNITAYNARLQGNITATSGTFENCTITNSCSVPASTVSGTLSANTIPNLSASKITSGTMSAGRISGGTMSGVTIASNTSVSAPTINASTTFNLANDYVKVYVGDHEGRSVRLTTSGGQTLIFRHGILTED